MQIKVPSGIGDSCWLLQKLINTGQLFDFLLPDSAPQRGKQIFDLLPSVSRSATYTPGVTFKNVDANNIARIFPNWADIAAHADTPRFGGVISLSCNEHLDTGHPLEDFLPDLETSYRIPWETGGEAAWDTVKEYFDMSRELIGIYTSSVRGNENWKGYFEKDWFELAELCYAHNPNSTIVLVGATWDKDMVDRVTVLLEHAGIPHLVMIMHPLGTVLEVMKRLKYFFAFPSGLGILAPTIGAPVTMFYPEHLEPMIPAWASKEDQETGLYHGCLFKKVDPKQAFQWAVDHGKL